MQLPQKPKFGSPCNGCGICCAIELCTAGELAFPGAKAPCPALKVSPDGSRTYCQLVLIEKTHNLKPILQTCLNIGGGCTMESDAPKHLQQNL